MTNKCKHRACDTLAQNMVARHPGLRVPTVKRNLKANMRRHQAEPHARDPGPIDRKGHKGMTSSVSYIFTEQTPSGEPSANASDVRV